VDQTLSDRLVGELPRSQRTASRSEDAYCRREKREQRGFCAHRSPPLCKSLWL